ncbi:hypothetical protein D3C79_773930 [compost metagenome]
MAHVILDEVVEQAVSEPGLAAAEGAAAARKRAGIVRPPACLRAIKYHSVEQHELVEGRSNQRSCTLCPGPCCAAEATKAAVTNAHSRRCQVVDQIPGEVRVGVAHIHVADSAHARAVAVEANAEARRCARESQRGVGWHRLVGAAPALPDEGQAQVLGDVELVIINFEDAFAEIDDAGGVRGDGGAIGVLDNIERIFSKGLDSSP